MYPANIYLFKVNNRNTRKRSEINSKLTIKTYSTPFSSVSIVEFEQVNVSWVGPWQTSMMKVLCENGSWLFPINYSHAKFHRRWLTGDVNTPPRFYFGIDSKLYSYIFSLLNPKSSKVQWFTYLMITNK